MAISEIEGLFKEHSRKNNPNIKPDDVCVKILQAFGSDVAFIDAELRRISQSKMNSLPLEDAMAFFTKFAGYHAFFSENELSFMLDSYVRRAGLVELQDLVEAFHRVIRYNPNMQQNASSGQGIHKQADNGGAGATSMMHMHAGGSSFAQFSEDGTSAVAMAASLVRPTHMPNIDDSKVEDLQKGCFIKNRTVRDYFSQAIGASNGTLTKINFINAIKQLGITQWSDSDTENVFN